MSARGPSAARNTSSRAAHTVWHWFGRRAGGDGKARPLGVWLSACRMGSRAGGASARSAFEYVTRQDKYEDPGLDPAIYTDIVGKTPEEVGESL